MNRAEIQYLVPYLVSLALSVGVFIYSWQHRKVRGAIAYTWFVGGQTLSIFGFIMELTNTNLQTKILWDKFQWFTEGTIIVISFLAFAIQFTEYKLRRPKLFWALLLVIPAIFNLLVITDGAMHHLIYLNPHLTSDYPFPDLEYGFTTAVYLFALFYYAVSFYGIGLLLQRIIRPHNLYRAQLATIAIGFLIPVIFSIFSLLNIQIAPQRDISPFSLALGNLVVAWGLFRFQIFEVVPIGRDKVFEDMVDPVVILNNQNLVIDLNHAMLDLMGRKANDVVGQPAKEVFADFPIPIKLYTNVTHARAETVFELHNKTISFELTVWPMYDAQKKLVGRIFVSHDITALKELEHTLRGLNVELEKRVQARTEDLAAAYDTTLEGWAKALEFRDKETEGHSRRVTETTLKVARALEIPEDELVHIHRGALLHDIGKMAIPDDILRKADSLTEEERAIVRKHPEIAYQLLEPIPYLKKAMEIPYCHHEKWDGTGYPRGLKGREIPVSARIFAVADVWDAIQSDRPYKKGWPRERAIEYITKQAGTHFDPRIVDRFLRLVEKGEI